MTKLASCVAIYECQRCGERFDKEVSLPLGIMPLMELYSDVATRITAHKCDDLRGTHWANVGVGVLIGTMAHEEREVPDDR